MTANHVRGIVREALPDHRIYWGGAPFISTYIYDTTLEDMTRLIMSLEDEMHEAAKELRFEYAARLRDEINELKRELKQVAEAR